MWICTLMNRADFCYIIKGWIRRNFEKNICRLSLLVWLNIAVRVVLSLSSCLSGKCPVIIMFLCLPGIHPPQKISVNCPVSLGITATHAQIHMHARFYWLFTLVHWLVECWHVGRVEATSLSQQTFTLLSSSIKVRPALQLSCLRWPHS